MGYYSKQHTQYYNITNYVLYSQYTNALVELYTKYAGDEIGEDDVVESKEEIIKEKIDDNFIKEDTI